MAILLPSFCSRQPLPGLKPENLFIKNGSFIVMKDYAELIRGDKVRANTPPEINQAIDTEIASTVRFYASKTGYEIGKRIEELNKEWDIERYIEADAAVFSIIGAVLGIKWNRNWFILPIIVAIFLLQYAVQGWCPPVYILRRIGIRTRQEIDVEKYALKNLRGDFDDLSYKGSSTDRKKNTVSESGIL